MKDKKKFLIPVAEIIDFNRDNINCDFDILTTSNLGDLDPDDTPGY